MRVLIRTRYDQDRHIAGYLVRNDWSARDLRFREMQFGAFDLGMRVLLTGVPFGEDRMTIMAWSFGELISYASHGTWARPGDLIGSGDEVTMTIDAIGAISNTVTAPRPPPRARVSTRDQVKVHKRARLGHPAGRRVCERHGGIPAPGVGSGRDTMGRHRIDDAGTDLTWGGPALVTGGRHEARARHARPEDEQPTQPLEDTLHGEVVGAP